MILFGTIMAHMLIPSSPFVYLAWGLVMLYSISFYAHKSVWKGIGKIFILQNSTKNNIREQYDSKSLIDVKTSDILKDYQNLFNIE